MEMCSGTVILSGIESLIIEMRETCFLCHLIRGGADSAPQVEVQP